MEGTLHAIFRYTCTRVMALHINYLQTWRSEGRRGLWLQIPTERAALIPVATSAGFEFHHAKPGYVMLTKWLPETASTIPDSLLFNVGFLSPAPPPWEAMPKPLGLD